jgi:hypothetical protein
MSRNGCGCWPPSSAGRSGASTAARREALRLDAGNAEVVSWLRGKRR